MNHSPQKWTKPYHGVSHYGQPFCRSTNGGRWATVHLFPDFTELLRWADGSGFSPPDETFYGNDHAERAREAGERWTLKGI